jgi:hypothetical protein
MTDSPGADPAEATAGSFGAGTRSTAWLILLVVLFIPLGLASLWVADLALGQTGVAGIRREWVLAAAAATWASALLIAARLTGRLLRTTDHARNPRVWDAIPLILAIVAAYAIAAAVRAQGGPEGGFETDHALPQLLVPVALLFVGAIEICHRLADPAAAPQAWRIGRIAAWATLMIAAAATLTSAGIAMNAPGSAFAVGIAAAYATFAAVHSFAFERRSMEDRSRSDPPS